MRKDIAKILESGQEATARIRVEHIFREENMHDGGTGDPRIVLRAQIVVRLPIIETQRCADLPELLQVQMLFAAKYGKELVAAAAERMPNCGVNRRIIELLSVRAPPTETKLKLLKEIAEEHDLDWDPSASEAEFLRPHADLLNGPDRFINASTFSLPKEEVANSYEDTESYQVSETTEPDENELDHPSREPTVYRPVTNVSADTNEGRQFISFLSPPPLSSHSAERSGPTLLLPSSSIPTPPKQSEQADSVSAPAQFVSNINNEACEDLPPSSSSIHQDPKQSEQSASTISF